MKLFGKLFINGQIELKTGLTIGGDKSSVEIGGIDNNVIKNSNGQPFIPGSSLKGKMRSLIEKAKGQYNLQIDFGGKNIASSKDYDYNVEKFLAGKNINIDDSNIKKIIAGPCECGKCSACKIFGTSASTGKSQPTRLYVRDSFLNSDIKDAMEKREGDFSRLELDYTESKWENTIDRVTSHANPRDIERVPAGAKFDFEIVYNFYEAEDIENLKVVFEAMALLQDDYLGANGSRGYGKIKFTELIISKKTLEDYKENKGKRIISETNTLEDINIKNIIDELKKAN